MHHIWGKILVLLCLSYTSLAVRMRWCYVPGEKQKCEKFVAALTTCAQNRSLPVDANCVAAKDRAACVEMIKNKDADLVTIGRKEIVAERKSKKLVLVVTEDYGLGKGVKYYGVAVVKKGAGFSIKDLRGKKSCHTGAGRTAGWDIPIGFLLSKRIMTRKGSSCSPYVAAANFFSKSCVPGVRSKFDPKDENLDNLCAICGGTGGNKCAYNSSEPYFGHHGALRCLAEGKGDVAFFKHGTVQEKASDYEYLCPDGSRKDIGEAKSCNLGTSPPQPVITWYENKDRETYAALLIAVSKNNCSGFQMFNSTMYGGEDLLFKDSTKELIKVEPKSPLETWLEPQFRKDLDALEVCPPPIGSLANKSVPFASWIGFIAFFFFHASI